MRKKLQRFEKNKSALNILEPGRPLYETIRGKWGKLFFRNSHPITIEIAAGRGEYAVGLAQLFPDRNFVAIDAKGDRLFHGSKIATDLKLSNVAFLRARIELIERFFAPGEVNEIWITFPGPYPKSKQENRRLTNQRFLNRYKKLLTPGGVVHFKTDGEAFFDYSLEQLKLRSDIEILAKTQDLYSSPLVEEVPDIQTHYEKRFLLQGKQIKYVRFRFKRPGLFTLTKQRISSTIRALLS